MAVQTYDVVLLLPSSYYIQICEIWFQKIISITPFVIKSNSEPPLRYGIATKLIKRWICLSMIWKNNHFRNQDFYNDKTFNFCKWHSRNKKSQFCHLFTTFNFRWIFFLRKTQYPIYKQNSFVLCLEVCLTRYYIYPLSAYFSYIKKSG